jgi:hypothetical protein
MSVIHLFSVDLEISVGGSSEIKREEAWHGGVYVQSQQRLSQENRKFKASPGLYSEFEANLGCVVRPCLKDEGEREREKERKRERV